MSQLRSLNTELCGSGLLCEWFVRGKLPCRRGREGGIEVWFTDELPVDALLVSVRLPVAAVAGI